MASPFSERFGNTSGKIKEKLAGNGGHTCKKKLSLILVVLCSLWCGVFLWVVSPDRDYLP